MITTQTCEAILWQYCQREDTPSYQEIESVKMVPGRCWKNMEVLSDYLLESHNIPTEIYLTMGMRSFAETNVIGYHYILKDMRNGIFFENQYFLWFGVALHKWTPDEFKKEKNKTSLSQWYVNNYGKQITEFMIAMKNLYRRPLYEYNILNVSNKEIKEVIDERKNYQFCDKRPIKGIQLFGVTDYPAKSRVDCDNKKNIKGKK